MRNLERSLICAVWLFVGTAPSRAGLVTAGDALETAAFNLETQYASAVRGNFYETRQFLVAEIGHAPPYTYPSVDVRPFYGAANALRAGDLEAAADALWTAAFNLETQYASAIRGNFDETRQFLVDETGDAPPYTYPSVDVSPFYGAADALRVADFDTAGDALWTAAFNLETQYASSVRGNFYETRQFLVDEIGDAPPYTHPTVDVGPFYGAADALRATSLTAVPEPSSLTLLGIGMAGFSGYGWRRRRRSQRANATAA